MAVDSDWYRLNADWWQSGWMVELPYPVNLLFPCVLSYFKSNGNRRGKCKAVPIIVFARTFGIPLADAHQLFEAMMAQPADPEQLPTLIVEGSDWVLTSWAEYQSADAIRKRRERELNSAAPVPDEGGESGECHGQDADVTDKGNLSRTNQESHGQGQFVTDKDHMSRTPTRALSRDEDSNEDSNRDITRKTTYPAREDDPDFCDKAIAAAAELPKWRSEELARTDLVNAERQFVKIFGPDRFDELDKFQAYYRNRGPTQSDRPFAVALMQWAQSGKTRRNQPPTTHQSSRNLKHGTSNVKEIYDRL